ncbi:S-layer protein domain-containing protein [Methanosarcina sp. KYL-1]|uniref:S-layer protein domain-containing protein n=1 Tax=Methanosarcina sp. KYL-1 TaxID=2602068 RepID=UPI00210178BC|nr:S-layer protein domain-containing protein [Methanosarcina sp. KYL-1]
MSFNTIPAAAASGGGERLSIILIDGDELYVRSGDSHTFLQGYQLCVKGADPEASRVWLELRREDVVLQDIIATRGTGFVYSRNSSEILNLTVDTIYAGPEGVLVRFSPVYQYLDPKLPRPQTPAGPLPDASENLSSQFPGTGTQVEGFDTHLFLLGFGAVLLVTGFFAGRGRKNEYKK